MGAIATAIAIAERGWSCISGPNHGQYPQDGGDGQNVHNLPPGKGLVDQFLNLTWRSTTLAKQNRVRRVPLLHIITYYYTLLVTLIRAERFQLDFIAEGDVCTLYVNGFFLAIYFDGYGEKMLQPTIPDIVLAQHKPSHPWRASEDKSSRL